MLDIEVAYPIVYPQRVRVFGVDDRHYQQSLPSGMFNTFLDAIDGSYCNRTAYNITGDSPENDPTYPDSEGYKDDRMCGVFTPTNVISISYSSEERQQSINYDQRQCSEWMKLGLIGVTVVGSTGNYGVAGNNNECISVWETDYVFNPLSLTNCPYVLAVGSTQLSPGNHGGGEGYEVGLNTLPYSSGGGFSNIYSAPAWQADAIEKYFCNFGTPYIYYNTSNNDSIGLNGGVFNIAGRGVPDISAIGANIVTIDEDSVHTTSAKSASAPIVGAILTRINEERLKANMTTIGFVTPALYANTSIFNDITEGNSTGCNTPGFLASEGWDPVTGLGTPDYPSMLEYFLSLGRK
jgi:tripeptidyl-peptidase-1